MDKKSAKRDESRFRSLERQFGVRTIVLLFCLLFFLMALYLLFAGDF